MILKLAVSTDDRIAAAGHKPVAITGEAAKARVHLLRAQCDAILVGIGTVLADDPLLTCRLPGMEARSPVRVVLDRALADSRRQPAGAFGARDQAVGDDLGPVGSAGRDEARRRRRPCDPRRHHIGAAARPRSCRPCCMRWPTEGITRLLVEGGARVASSFVTAGLVDEVWLLRGPEPIGADGIPALDALPLSALTGSPAFKPRASETLQNDTLTIYERA